MTEVIFENNTAVYGYNIASYAVSIKPTETEDDVLKLKSIVSGQPYDQSLVLGLVDYDNQITNQDDLSRITVAPLNSTASVRSIVSRVVKSGVGDFQGIVFAAIPGISGYHYSVDSPFINRDNYFKAYKKNYETEYIIIDFRDCNIGEYQENNECTICPPGSYSVALNQKQ
jgi:hypothetical protein